MSAVSFWKCTVGANIKFKLVPSTWATLFIKKKDLTIILITPEWHPHRQNRNQIPHGKTPMQMVTWPIWPFTWTWLGKAPFHCPAFFRSPPKEENRARSHLAFSLSRSIWLWSSGIFAGFSLKGLRPLSSLLESGTHRERGRDHLATFDVHQKSDDYMHWFSPKYWICH